MLLATALAPKRQDVLNRRLLFKTNRQQCSNQSETITHHFFVSGIGQKKTVDAAKIVAAQKMLLKQKPSKTFVNGLLGFITRHLYSAGSACVLLTHGNTSCPSIWATLSALLINILLGSFQLFLHSDQPLSEGEITCSGGVCQSGEAALSTPEAVVASRTDRQTALMCNRRRPAATSSRSRRASFSALAR